MEDDKFENFKKIIVLYSLKQVPRNSTNSYHDEKDHVFYTRRETTAEHIYSSLRLADFFLTNEDEFFGLDRLKVYHLLMYHDDPEIIARDIGISERDKRKNKEKDETYARSILYKAYPSGLDKKLITYNAEFREKKTIESKFSNAIDKLDSLVHEFQFPLDWGPKGFDEKHVRTWFQPAFEYSPTFMDYFEEMIRYLDTEGYFEEWFLAEDPNLDIIGCLQKPTYILQKNKSF